MTTETKTEIAPAQVPLSELQPTEMLPAWLQRLRELEKARADLFADGEKALAAGLTKLSRETVGEEIGKAQEGYPIIRQALTLTKRGTINYPMPEELRFLIEDIHRGEASLKQPAQLWIDIERHELNNCTGLTLGAQVGTENFDLTMHYLPQSSYYLAKQRRDDEIVRFSGHYTGKFEHTVDRMKDLNRADTNTKLSCALGLIQLISDLRTPPSHF